MVEYNKNNSSNSFVFGRWPHIKKQSGFGFLSGVSWCHCSKTSRSTSAEPRYSSKPSSTTSDLTWNSTRKLETGFYCDLLGIKFSKCCKFSLKENGLIIRYGMGCLVVITGRASDIRTFRSILSIDHR